MYLSMNPLALLKNSYWYYDLKLSRLQCAIPLTHSLNCVAYLMYLALCQALYIYNLLLHNFWMLVYYYIQSLGHHFEFWFCTWESGCLEIERCAQDQSSGMLRFRIKVHYLFDFSVHNPYTTLTALAFKRVQGCAGKENNQRAWL